jgi:hypothetical protein
VRINFATVHQDRSFRSVLRRSVVTVQGDQAGHILRRFDLCLAKFESAFEMNNIQRGRVTCYTDDIESRGILVGHSTLIFNCHYPNGEWNLSKLVNLRAARKPISDARTTTYFILSTGSGPGGRWFKSTRPDQLFCNQQFKDRRMVVERMVPDQEVGSSNPLALTAS